LRHGQHIQSPHGGLRIYCYPEPSRKYAIGVDTSAGIRDGDYSCAQVLAMDTGEQVAEWHGLYRATMWGTACARLGWFYNTAVIAFETHPSPHGLRAYDACHQYGYDNLWVQRKWDDRVGKFIAKKGWVRTPHSTLVMLERVRDAIARGARVHSEGLLDELAAITMNQEKGKVESTENDDRVMAYAIASIMVDDAWSAGEAEPDDKPPEDMAEAYWRRREERLRLGASEEPTPQEVLWDGN